MKQRSELERKALKLYTPPFKHQYGYIFDATNNMVADHPGEDAALRIRGWGRISYLSTPEALQDTVGDLIAEAMTKFWVEELKSS